MFEIKIPKMGMSTVEVDLTVWHVHMGDRVEKGTPLADLESEKATFTLESEVAGTVAEILVPAGEVTEVGAVICRIREAG